MDYTKAYKTKPDSELNLDEEGFDTFEEDLSAEIGSDSPEKDNFDMSDPNKEDLDDNTEDFYDTDFDEGGFGGGGIAPMEKHNDLLKELTNFDPFIKEKFYDWLGWKWDQEAGKYIEDTQADPLLNYKGAKQMISILSTFARKNNIITDLDKNSYMEMVGDLNESIAYSIGTNMELYGIKSNAHMLLLWNDVEATVKLVLQGAAGGKYNILLSTTTNRSENISGNPNMGQSQQNKRGMVSKIRGMFMGGN